MQLYHVSITAVDVVDAVDAADAANPVVLKNKWYSNQNHYQGRFNNIRSCNSYQLSTSIDAVITISFLALQSHHIATKANAANPVVRTTKCNRVIRIILDKGQQHQI